MKPYVETILYLKSLIVILESLQDSNPDDEEYSKTQVGVLTDLNKNITNLIKKLEIKDVTLLKS